MACFTLTHPSWPLPTGFQPLLFFCLRGEPEPPSSLPLPPNPPSFSLLSPSSLPTPGAQPAFSIDAPPPGSPPLLEEHTPKRVPVKRTLQERQLNVLTIQGHTAPMLQLQQATKQAWQADGDRASAHGVGVISTLPGRSQVQGGHHCPSARRA